ncbi:MAG: hypothetical protein ABMA13_16065 [Chthoniobacteraceae bacterium]
MKTPALAFCSLLISAALAADPPEPPIEISGRVVRVTQYGVFLYGVISDYGQANEKFRGDFFLTGHPKQKSFADGDEVNGIKAQRIGNLREGESTTRAYKYLGSRYAL